ncbi:MAG: diaminopimelate epimerase [Desulfobacterales bacterium CG07_land_8_20_14_0_80_52_14]|nr:MAG: diaminopimelate epimerase [Desulfobacterales bacterium CG07_land_8_20_14_0_80_52_14]
MKKISFFKMSGSGNDFIVIDNQGPVIDEAFLTRFITGVCRRRLSAGADGLILVERSGCADFRWRYYNSDGSRAEMCGNGARCVSRFAYLKGIAGASMSFESDTGLMEAKIIGDRVKVRMPMPHDMILDESVKTTEGLVRLSSINTGVPHAVVEVQDLEAVDVRARGRELRFHRHFAPAGTNVNFIVPEKDGAIAIRTYERGVEDETLACGTGAIASALLTAVKQGTNSPIRVLPKGGGHLTIHFNREKTGFDEVFLEGDARVIYEGTMWDEAWNEKGTTNQ